MINTTVLSSNDLARAIVVERAREYVRHALLAINGKRSLDERQYILANSALLARLCGAVMGLEIAELEET